MSLLLLFTTPGAAAPGIVARGIVAGGQYDAHHARRRARLVAAAGALLLVPAVRAGAATTIEGTGTLSAPIATVTGTGGPPATGAPVAGGIVTVDYRAHFAAQRRARLDAAPSQIVLGAQRLPPVVGSGTLAAPIATVTGSGTPIATRRAVRILAPDYGAHRKAAEARLDALRSQVLTPKRRPATIITGTGALLAPIATLTGAGSPVVTGAGTLSAPLATLLGLGAPVVTGSGTLAAPIATLTGAGVGVITGAGTLSAPIAQVIGTETRPPRLAIDVRLAPVLALEPSLGATIALAVRLAPVLRVAPSLDPGP